jgi:hypothetical protein
VFEITRQNPSGMRVGKYVPYFEQIKVDLPDLDMAGQGNH